MTDSPAVIPDEIAPPSSRLLTLLFGARNDAYMGDFKFRFSTCLNYLARNLQAIDRLRDVEVLVVDWNSDVPLHTVLPLSEAARQLVRFLVVPPAIAQPAQQDSPFPIPIVQNVAIRRARGTFIGQTDSDILFTQASLQALFNILDGKLAGIPLNQSLLVSSRRHMPFQQILRKPSLDEIDSYLARNAAVFPREELFPGFATPSALALLHRDVWEACGGYDEKLIYWGWMEIDLYLRLMQRMPWFDVASFGVNLIHIEHYSSARGTAAKPHRKINPTVTSLDFVANNNINWGLADHHLEITTGMEHPVPEPIPAAPADTAESVIAGIKDAENQRFVQEFAKTAQIASRAPGILYTLAWYARERFPRTYVDVGVRFPATACLVALACPGVEIYGIDSWHDGPADANPPVWATSNAIAQFSNKQSYTRFITGDPATAVDRLFASPAAPHKVDLVMLRATPAFGDSVKNALALAARLSAGGAIVLGTLNNDELEKISGALAERYPNWLRLRLESVTGEGQATIFLSK